MKLPLHCVYTPAHEILFREWFCPSLPAGFGLCASRLEGIEGPGDYLSEEFIKCVQRKTDSVVASLASGEPGGVLVWSDVDILFGSCIPGELRGLLASSGCDILFQQERPGMPEINTGFFVCRRCPEVLGFFQNVVRELASDPAINEQAAANRLLGTPARPRAQAGRACSGVIDGMSFGALPRSYYARTHGWPPPLRFAIYHANYTKGTDGVGQKIAQLREIASIRRHGLPAYAWSVLRRIPGKLRGPA